MLSVVAELVKGRRWARWRVAAHRVILSLVESSVSFLIAEDDELVGRLLARALSAHGDTHLVTSVADARSALEARSFTGVVVDVGLPDGSGLDLIDDARRQDPATTALVVSGHVDAPRLAKAHRLRAAYLLKPVDTTQIELFAVRTRSRLHERSVRVAALVRRWAQEHRLTGAEAAILELAAEGHSRVRLAELRNVSPSTLKKQIQIALAKTGDASLESAVNRLLRAVVDDH
jgi:DNA-binding NarL/FixJ family response regulator